MTIRRKHLITHLRHFILSVLIVLLLTLAMLEVALRLFDPSGVGRYGYDLFLQLAAYTDDPRGYRLQAGTHPFSNWGATILADGTRLVPDTNRDVPVKLTFIGDSVTYGFGVNDHDTFINLLASDLTDLHLANAGVSGYNSTQALQSLEVYESDFYLWLTIANDIETPEVRRDVSGYIPTFTTFHLHRLLTLRSREQGSSGTNEPFVDRTRYLKEVENAISSGVLVVTFNDTHGLWLADEVEGVIVIPHYTASISPADGHPNPAGHQQIAASLLASIQQYVVTAINEEV